MITRGQYKNDPSGWSIDLNNGIASGPAGQKMEFIDFVAWSYGISREKAEQEIWDTLFVDLPPGSGKTILP